MLLTLFFALLFIGLGTGGYLLLNARLRKRKYSVATVKEWWQEEFSDSGITRTETLYKVAFTDTGGMSHNATLERAGDNRDGAVQEQDELDISYSRANFISPPTGVKKVAPPDRAVGACLALIFFGIYLLGFPLFNRVLVWLLPTTH